MGYFYSLKSDVGLEWVGDGLRVGLLTALGAADLGALLTLASRWRLSLKIREGCLGSGPSLLLRALMGDETQVFSTPGHAMEGAQANTSAP